MTSQTKKLISNLKKEIEKRKRKCKIYQINMHKDRELARLKAQLLFAEKLIKAIKEDIKNCREPLIKFPEGNSNTYFLDYEKINKILDKAIKWK